MDKQILRNHLETLDWDHSYPPPRLDESVLQQVSDGYVRIFQRLFPEHASRVGVA